MADAQLRSLPVPDGLEGERLDAGLARLLGLSRSRAAELAADGQVTLDGAPAGKSERLRAGSWLEVVLPPVAPAATGAPTAADRAAVEGGDGGGPVLGIVHDDDDLVVVDKPVGVAAHPSPGWAGPTVVGVLAASGFRVATTGAAERQGVVHRLDAGTSGLMVVAKTEHAYSVLKAAFRERTVEKTYHALVQGHPDPSGGTIDAPIGRHPSADHRFAVVSAQAGGRDSVTHYETLEAFAAASLLRVRLETGRTHQIRVHFSALRHPCVGDLTYGADPRLAERLGVARQWLHAVGLGFDHPSTGERVRYGSGYPADLAAALERLAGS